MANHLRVITLNPIRKIIITLTVVCFISLSFAARPFTIPALQEWTDGTGSYSFNKNATIVVSSAHFNSLRNSAVTFSEDVFLLTYEKGIPCTLSVKKADVCNVGDILLTIDSSDVSIGPSGYKLEIGDFITIKALTDNGVFCGTRTVLQLLKQGYSIKSGSAGDWPIFKERGFMVDAGRKWFPASWLYKHVRDLAYIKNNIFHIHLSDNLGFRLPSKKHPEITSPFFYTLAQIDTLNKLAEKYHITIVPEIDMPGHMDYILSKHPEIAIKSTVRPYVSLHIGKDSAYIFAREILEEFIPLFPGPFWHVGADEYPEDVYDKDTLFKHYAKENYGTNATPQDCYYGFINWANKLVRSHGKIMRAWKDGLVSTSAVKIDTNIIVEHWYRAYGPPAQTMLDRGHSLINCHYTRLYFTLGGGGLNAQDLYDNFEPYMLEGSDPVSNKHHPGILGAKTHVWCDDSGAQSTATIANNIMDGLRAVAQKTWESPKLVTPFSNFKPIITTIGRAPGFTDNPITIPEIKVIEQTVIDGNNPVKVSQGPLWNIDYNRLTLEMLSEGRHDIALFDLKGKKLLSFTGIGKKSYHFIGSMASGIYVLKISVDKESSVLMVPVIGK